MTQRLAIYDMDRTITKSGTYTPFLIHAALKLSPWRLLLAPLVPVVMSLYAAKLISRARLKEWNQRIMLGFRLDPETLRPVAKSYAQQIMKLNVYPQALAQIAADKAQGYRVVLATASYHIYVDSIAEELGIADVIATKNKRADDGAILALIDGENCYGQAKLRMVEAWLAAQNIKREAADIRFYSDHVSDAPVMEWANTAYATNPHPPMEREAQKRGWNILDWRLAHKA